MSRAEPAWARELSERYRGGTIAQFVIHGAVTDLVPASDGRFLGLKDYLTEEVFPGRDLVLYYDEAAGIHFRDTETMGNFHRVAQAVDLAGGQEYSGTLPRDPARALLLLERFLRARCLGAKPRQSAAVILDFAHTVAPASDVAQMSTAEQAVLVTLLKWAQEPAFLSANLTICLIVENLADLHPHLVSSPFIAKVSISLPDREARLAYARSLVGDTEFQSLSDVDETTLSKMTAGLSRVNIRHLVKQALGNQTRITMDYLLRTKKQLIEQECFGLLEFLEPRYTLDMVCGHEAAKTWLREDAELIRKGELDALPMGYLLCGPVGTGKTFLIQCYTGSIGIPCVRLLNFRSQWQGVTESNWEKILAVLKATGPIGVMIDEADAALGKRDSSGDSGTSSRVFSMLASQMGDTRYRGSILWFLITCRPDLLPVDLKRQGRAEVHIPLFYPQDDAERAALMKVMTRKLETKLGRVELPDLEQGRRLSGADIEGVLIRAKRRSLLRGHKSITRKDFEEEWEAFVPPTYGAEIDFPILAAVMECTDRRFLPEDYREADREELGRRFAALKELVE